MPLLCSVLSNVGRGRRYRDVARYLVLRKADLNSHDAVSWVLSSGFRVQERERELLWVIMPVLASDCMSWYFDCSGGTLPSRICSTAGLLDARSSWSSS